MERYLQDGDYGMELTLDLYDCDPEVLRSDKKLKQYVDELCKILDMKQYGDCYLPYFGLNAEHTAGYSLLQFIETSSITGHFSEYTNAAYLNIFSCKDYDPTEAAEFSKNFFKAKRMEKRLNVRH
jgi:S-adenosylmethionine/arginine decarboxylase-like enzyme